MWQVWERRETLVGKLEGRLRHKGWIIKEE
jgi:hypothetical protein